jgi:hypothetical protein
MTPKTMIVCSIWRGNQPWEAAVFLHGIPNAGHRPGSQQPPDDPGGLARRIPFLKPGRLEFASAILLGLAALLAAWSAYQSHDFLSEMESSFTQANLNISAANGYYSEGDQIRLHDELIFLEYQAAKIEGNDAKAAVLRRSLMSDQLQAAIDWWEEPGNNEQYNSPFVEENLNYRIEEYDRADELADETLRKFIEGERDRTTGETYNLITVILSGVLFLLGISSSFRVLGHQLALIGIGSALMLGAVFWMTTLPVHWPIG